MHFHLFYLLCFVWVSTIAGLALIYYLNWKALMFIQRFAMEYQSGPKESGMEGGLADSRQL